MGNNGRQGFPRPPPSLFTNLGTSGQAIIIDPTTGRPTWGTPTPAPPATPDQARINRSTNFTLTDATITAIIFDTVRFDTNSLANIGSHPTRLTCQTTGLYLITGNVAWDDYTAGAILACYIDLNSLGAVARVREQTPTGDTGALVQSVTTLWQLTAGDYVQLYVRSDGGGGSQQIDTISQTSPEFSMVKVG